MTDDTQVREPTRRELAETLARANALIESQGQEIERLKAMAAAAPAPSDVRTPPPQPAPQARPYKGLVRAKDACWIGHLRPAGDIWEHEVDCLWTDDPFEPVVQVGVKDDGSPRVEPNKDAPAPLAFHLRLRTYDALRAREATPTRASQW